MNSKPAARLLIHLGLPAERPRLDYLNRIIAAHQRRVPFETLTKLVDYEAGRAKGDFLPALETYVERIVHQGAGGLCWTLARGLHELLADLGFSVAYMYMAPGHCCVRVELEEGAFYADVGYAAPLFRAFPLFQSFELPTHRESFRYQVDSGRIEVTRNPGPTKILDPTPRRLDELKPMIDAANAWSAPQSFLRRIAYAGYLGDDYVSLNNRIWTVYHADGVERTELSEDEVGPRLEASFGVDRELYSAAVEIQRRYLEADVL